MPDEAPIEVVLLPVMKTPESIEKPLSAVSSGEVAFSGSSGGSLIAKWPQQAMADASQRN